MVVVVLALAVCAAGYVNFRVEKQKIEHEEYEALAAIGRLKAEFIQRWRGERIAEARRAAKDSVLIDLVSQARTAGGDETQRERLMQALAEELTDQDYVGVMLFDRKGRLLISHDHHQGTPNPVTAEAVQRCLAEGRPVFSNFYKAEDGDVHLDLVVPVGNPEKEAIGALLLRYEAKRFLYPVLATWPTHSRSAETYLVQKGGEDVVYVSNLRHQQNAALALRLPLSDTLLSAAQAVAGRRGFFLGHDYRGQKVLSDLQAIPETPWFIVTEIDTAEILPPALSKSLTIVLSAGLLIFSAGMLVAFLYRKRQADMLRQLVISEQSRVDALKREQESHSRNLDILETAIDGFCVMDRQGVIVEVNDRYCELMGMKKSELIGRPITDFDALMTPEQVKEKCRHVITEGRDRFETRHRARDGRLIDIEVSSQFRPSENVFVSFLSDISERKAALERAQTLSRLYAALGECNQAILHCRTDGELFREICRNVVRKGGMQMTAVFLLDPLSRKLNPVTSYGDAADYLESIEISSDPDNPLSHGPAGTAVRENRPVWCQDFPNDPHMAPWKDKAAVPGWQAAAAIPLLRAGKVVGALGIYSRTRNAFAPDVQDLLVRIGNNVSFALDNYDRENERVLAEEEARKLQAAVEQSAEIIIIVDPSGVIEYVNPAFEHVTLYSRSEVLGKPLHSVQFEEKGSAYFERLWDSLSVGRTWRGQFQNRRKDGTVFWESAVFSPVFDDMGRIVHFVGVKEDISERIAMETHLQEALRRAEAASKTKGEFLAVMSHELRTPLNGILGFAELLGSTPLDGEQQTLLKTIQDSGDHLLEIVNDILDFSSMEKGAMKLDSVAVPVVRLVESACLSLRQAALAKGLNFSHHIEPDVPDFFFGDERRVRQILINLTGNAVKFTPGGSVSVHVSSCEVEGLPGIAFSIHDTGPGICPEVLDHLFQPFTQANSSLDRPYEGTGLGLAISQRLAEVMGGRITVDSKPHAGSVFTLKLPVGSGTTAVIAAPRETGPPASYGRGILVAEDDRVNRMLVQRLLGSMGISCELAENGRIAVEKFLPDKYSAILMDMQMPEMSGVEATKMIRERERGTGAHVPIIALTANVMDGDRRRCLDAGMDDFLSKPFKKEEFAEKLAHFGDQEPERKAAPVRSTCDALNSNE